MQKSTQVKALAVGGVLMVVMVATVLFVRSNQQSGDSGVPCTMEAMLCPDGSAVGRQGPNCEFPECPQNLEGAPLRQEE